MAYETFADHIEPVSRWNTPTILTMSLLLGMSAFHTMWYLWVKDHRKKTGQKETPVDKSLTYLYIGCFATLGIFFWAMLRGPKWLSFPVSRSVTILGIALGLASIALFHQAHAFLAENWMPIISKLEGQKLITQGPYAYIRHPIYASMLMFTLSLVMVSGNIGTLPLLGGTVLITKYRVPREDALMSEMFKAQHSAWVKKTYKLIPLVW